MFVEILVFILTFALTLGIIKWQNSIQKSFPAGPRGIPIFGYIPFLGQVPCLTLSKLTNRWGSIFSLRLGQYRVVFLHDIEKIRNLYKLEASTGRVQLTLFEKRGKYGLTLLDGEDWKEVKRFLLRCLKDHGFGKHSIQSTIHSEVLKLIQIFRDKKDSSTCLKPYVEVTVINVIWLILTGEEIRGDDPSKQDVLSIMSQGISDQNIVGIAAFLPWLAKMFPSWTGYAKGLRYFEAPNEMARQVIEEHLQKHEVGNEVDLIDHFITKIKETSCTNSPFYGDTGMKNLQYTLIDMLYAGADTISSTLGWAFMYLAMWPEKQAKLQDEIDAVVGNERLPCIEDRTRMPYAEAYIFEVLRKSCVVPMGLLHRTLEDIKLYGYTFPKGTIFLSNLYHVFNDPKHWKNPQDFNPERFLSADGEVKKDDCLIPFFVGKRTCPGENLAMTELFLILTAIVQKFTFNLDPTQGLPDLSPHGGFILVPPQYKILISERSV